MTTKIPQSLFILAAGALSDIGSASAQNSNTSGDGARQLDPGHPRVNQINQRETNPQRRIANGINNDKLTPGQASRLEKGEQRLEDNERRTWPKTTAISPGGTTASSIAKPIA